MRRSDLLGIGLVGLSAVMWTASRVLGSDVVPAKIVVQPVPTTPPPLPRLVIPGVRFTLGAGSSATGADAATVASSTGKAGGALPNLVGTSYFADNPGASWALVSDGGGIRKIERGSRVAGSVVTAVGDGVLYLADGRQLHPGAATEQVPSIGNTTVPVDIAEPSPTPPSQTPAPTPSPARVPSGAGAQVLDPFALPTPQAMLPGVYPSPRRFR